MSKPLPPITQADRTRVRKALVQAYGYGHTTSGIVRVTSLGFSSNPNEWRISAKTVNGTPYTGMQVSRADVHLTAVLSGDWLEKPLPDLILRNEDRREYEIIAGIHEFTPPSGITRAELLVVSKTNNRGLQMETQCGFRFAIGEFTAVAGLGLTRYPSQIKLAARVAAKEFRQLVAAHVAARMLPKPKGGLSMRPIKYTFIDEFDDLKDATKLASQTLTSFAKTRRSIKP